MANLKHTLKEHNVSPVSYELGDGEILLQCDNCGQTWSQNIIVGERLLKGYWHCPNKCNYEEQAYKYGQSVRSYFAERNRRQRQKQKRGLKL